MSSFKRYIEKNCIYSPIIKEKPAIDLNLIVVIPCYNEPDILTTITSIAACYETKKSVEIIIVINSSERTPEHIVHQNYKTEKELLQILDTFATKNKKFHVIHKTSLPKKHAGVGLARKIGMDEAIQRFNQINNQEGVIISFDADSICAPNWLTSIEDYYSINLKANGSCVYFEHPISGNAFNTDIYNAIIQYELFLRYYNQALRLTGYPFAFHTVGSCFNVKASVYATQGGMNRKQAGEDFYFLQKIIPLGNFAEINTTCIYPSSRPSDRVPFGTGPIINRLIKNKEPLETYSFESFLDIKKVFNQVNNLFRSREPEINNMISNQSEIMQSFLIDNNILGNILEINTNSSSLENFRKRFYKWFNAFKILKYLNHSHKNNYKLKPIIEVASELLIYKSIQTPKHSKAIELLNKYREIEKDNPYSII